MELILTFVFGLSMVAISLILFTVSMFLSSKSFVPQMWVQECCKREQEGCVTFKNYPKTFLATKIPIDCSFLTKNCSPEPSELTKVSCSVLIAREGVP